MKAAIVDFGSSVFELKIVTVAECVAEKSCGEIGENESEVMEEIRVCGDDDDDWFDLNDFQYFDSGDDCVDLFEFGFSFGFTANVFTIDSAIDEDEDEDEESCRLDFRVFRVLVLCFFSFVYMMMKS